MEKLTEFDMAEYLDTEELRRGYLDYNAKDGTPEDLLNAIKTVARAKGMTTQDGNPAFSTVWNILRSLGYTLTPTPIAHNPM